MTLPGYLNIQSFTYSQLIILFSNYHQNYNSDQQLAAFIRVKKELYGCQCRWQNTRNFLNHSRQGRQQTDKPEFSDQQDGWETGVNTCQCRHLVCIGDIFRQGDKLYVVEQLCELGTVTTGVKSQGEIRQILYAVTKALVWLHSRGFTHRDVKLDNILISKGYFQDEPIYKLGDYGLATSEPQIREYAGSLPSMAPEIVQNKPYCNKVDIWALGILAFELCFGYNYFLRRENSLTPQQLRKAISEHKFCMTQFEACTVSSKMQQFIVMCLSQNPSERPSAMWLLEHASIFDVRDCHLPLRTILDQQLNLAKLMEETADELAIFSCHRGRSSEFIQIYLLLAASTVVAQVDAFFHRGIGLPQSFVKQIIYQLMREKHVADDVSSSILKQRNRLQAVLRRRLVEFRLYIKARFDSSNLRLIEATINNIKNARTQELIKEELAKWKQVAEQSSEKDLYSKCSLLLACPWS